MSYLSAIAMAFSMYSKIPMPQVQWNKQNMKYILCFFPLIGVVSGLFLQLWIMFCQWRQVGTILTAAICVLIPLLVSGGIHLDGFCDTVDGLSSHQTIEKKLQILSDPNAGAFAVMSCIGYLLLYFALWCEMRITKDVVMIVALTYVLVRSMSGYAMVVLPCAKTSGLARLFADNAHKKIVERTMLGYILVLGTVMAMVNFLYFLPIVAVLLTVFLYYRTMSKKQFGGITGDLAGYFLQLAEVSVLAVIVVVQKFM